MPMNTNEQLLPLVKAVEAATGRRVHLSSCLRWAQRGTHGVYLETHMLGGRRLCSVEAVARYMEGCTSATSRKPILRSPSDKQRQSSIQQANRELDEAGV